ncbi:MAG: amidohydrolase family protein [Alphaproteobacteria bacterium]
MTDSLGSNRQANLEWPDGTAPSRRRVLGAIAALPVLAAVGMGGASMARAQSGAAPGRGAAAGFPVPDPARGFVLQPGAALVLRDGRHDVMRAPAILVRGGVIEEIRTTAFPGEFPHLRLPGQFVLPGFISAHTHTCSATPTRGLIEGGRPYGRPLELVETLSDTELDDLTAFNLMELLKSGCTTQVEMSLSQRQMDSYVRVAARWGVRGYPSAMVPGIDRLFPIWFRADDKVLMDSASGTLAEIERNLAQARKVKADNDNRLRPMMAPHAPDTHTPETMRALDRAARELGNGLHIHLSQVPVETASVRRLWGMTPLRWLESLGLLTQPVFAAHLNEFDWQADGALLADRPVIYAHCPSAEGAGGGTQPYPEALAAGVKAAIGIDTHSNDFVENLKLAVLYGRQRARLLGEADGTPRRLPAVMDGIDSATLVPAAGLGRDDIGRIEPGARADLVSIDVAAPLVGSGAFPPEPVNNLLYANGRFVRHVMTDGQFQVFDGTLESADENAVRRKGAQVARKIWGLLRDEDWFTPTAGG